MIRSGISFVSWVVAVVAAIVTVPTLWIATHIADEDGYVGFTRPFVSDTQLRTSLVDAITDEAFRRGGLPSSVRPVVDRAVNAVATRIAKHPGFAGAWETSQRRTHQLNFGSDATTDRLTADVGPIASFVAKEVSGDLPVQLPVPDKLLVPIHDAPARPVLDQVEKTPSHARNGLLVLGLGTLLCFVLARRRINAVVGLGAGAVITAGVLWLGTGLALPEVLDRTPARGEFARTMRDLLVDQAADSLNQWLLVIGMIGAVVLVIAMLGRSLPGR